MYCFVHNREHKKCVLTYVIRREFAKIDKVSHI